MASINEYEAKQIEKTDGTDIYYKDWLIDTHQDQFNAALLAFLRS